MNYRPARATMLFALALAAAQMTTAATRKPPPLTGELLLDMTDPMVIAHVGAVELRLRVELEQKKLIELNPAAVAKLEAAPPDPEFRFEPGFEAKVGRETLPGIEAPAPIEIGGRKLLALVASHGRDCCAGVDGSIGVSLLPYATIRLVRSGVSGPVQSLDFLIDDNAEQGPQTMIPIGRTSILAQFSLERTGTVATSSAGAILARAYGGKLTPDGGSAIAAFGIRRPTAMLIFPRGIGIAGFSFDRLPVRLADFAGHHGFPSGPDEPGDIVVAKKIEQQPAWPVVLIGRDRTDRCAEIIFDALARRMTLRCAFTEPR